MPTRTQQGDLMLCAYASHGDTRAHLPLPARSRRSASTWRVEAFDLAERFQTPVFVLSDLDIGMNDWMVPKLQWDDSYRPDRGKVLSAEELEQLKKFYRYLDVDGDGIPPRTLPGVHPKGAYFTRGSGHNKFGAYTEDSDEYQEVVDRLDAQVPDRGEGRAGAGHRRSTPGATIGLVTVGGCDAAVRRGARRAGRARASRSTTCGCAASRSATRSEQFLDAARGQLRGRAEPRRAVAQPAHARDGRAASTKLRVGPLLRRASR